MGMYIELTIYPSKFLRNLTFYKKKYFFFFDIFMPEMSQNFDSKIIILCEILSFDELKLYKFSINFKPQNDIFYRHRQIFVIAYDFSKFISLNLTMKTNMLPIF